MISMSMNSKMGIWNAYAFFLHKVDHSHNVFQTEYFKIKFIKVYSILRTNGRTDKKINLILLKKFFHSRNNDNRMSFLATAGQK